MIGPEEEGEEEEKATRASSRRTRTPKLNPRARIKDTGVGPAEHGRGQVGQKTLKKSKKKEHVLQKALGGAPVGDRWSFRHVD